MSKVYGPLAFVILIAVLVVGAPVMILAWRSSDALRLSAAAGFALAWATLVLASLSSLQIYEAREQTRKAQYASARPLLVPQTGHGFEDISNPAVSDFAITIRNVGTGVANNVRGAILARSNARTIPHQLFGRLDIPLANNDGTDLRFYRGGTLFQQDDQISNISLLPPTEFSSETLGANPLNRHDRLAARLTLSYTDVFGFKHASFFDLTTTTRWIFFVVKNEIALDLGELDEGKSMKSSLDSQKI
jgi:hypothetical protein